MIVDIPVGLVAALFAGAISGLSGFGYAPASVPLLMLVLGPATVVVVLSLVGFVSRGSLLGSRWDASTNHNPLRERPAQ